MRNGGEQCLWLQHRKLYHLLRLHAQFIDLVCFIPNYPTAPKIDSHSSTTGSTGMTTSYYKFHTNSINSSLVKMDMLLQNEAGDIFWFGILALHPIILELHICKEE